MIINTESVPYDPTDPLHVRFDFNDGVAALATSGAYDDPIRPHRLFEGGTEPADINGQQLASVINFAVRVGQGTENLQNLAALVERLGVRRVK